MLDNKAIESELKKLFAIDFASKEETRQQVENAAYFVEKVEMYLDKK